MRDVDQRRRRPARGTPRPGGGAGRWSRRRRRRCAAPRRAGSRPLRRTPRPVVRRGPGRRPPGRRARSAAAPATTCSANCAQGGLGATAPIRPQPGAGRRGRRARRRRRPAPRRDARPAAPRRTARRGARGQHHSIRTSSTTSSRPDLADRRVRARPAAGTGPPRRGERRLVVVADHAGAGLGERRPDRVGVRHRDVGGELVERLAARRARAPAPRSARARGQRLRRPRRRPGRRWCARSAARSRRPEHPEGAALRRRPGDAVHALEEQRVVHDQQVGAPRPRPRRATVGRRVDGEQHLARPSPPGSPSTSPTASHESAVAGGYQPCSRSTASLRVGMRATLGNRVELALRAGSVGPPGGSSWPSGRPCRTPHGGQLDHTKGANSTDPSGQLDPGQPTWRSPPSQ